MGADRETILHKTTVRGEAKIDKIVLPKVREETRGSVGGNGIDIKKTLPPFLFARTFRRSHSVGLRLPHHLELAMDIVPSRNTRARRFTTCAVSLRIAPRTESQQFSNKYKATASHFLACIGSPAVSKTDLERCYQQRTN